nr:MAG TPA: hypothetical protein [Caudoviricetes sp.]
MLRLDHYHHDVRTVICREVIYSFSFYSLRGLD